MNINFIASAGTGKTHNLVEEIIKKIKNEQIKINELLILTFTEKAAAELEERIIQRLKKELKETKNKNIHKQILEIGNSHIGTFHSIFLRFLKKYPEITQIDSSTQILSSDNELFLNLQFEKWIEIDFNENPDSWIEIIEIINKSSELKNIFTKIYQNRLKIKNKIDLDTKNLKQEIQSLKQKLQNLIDDLFKNYNHILEHIYKTTNGEGFRNSPYKIKETLENNKLTELLDEESKNIGKGNISFIFKNSTPLKDYIKKEVIPLFENGLKDLDKQIEETVIELKNLTYDYNAKILLKKYIQFQKFVEKVKKEENILDFNDILDKTLKLLSENPQVTEDIKNKFKYIFIDEFQDTDEIQLEVIKKITNNNLLVFGDPKQCIYEWRDANLESYLKFLENNNFENEPLDQNFRSSPLLLEFFNHLFTRDTLLTHIDKKYRRPVVSGKPQEFENKNSVIKFIEIDFDKTKYTNAEIEATYIVKEIKNLLNEGYNFSDILILFRKNTHLNIFKKILQKYNIPVKTSSNENLFEQPEVINILNILKYIEYPQDKTLLLKILKSPLYFLTEEELYKNKENLNLEAFEYYTKPIIELSKNKLNLTIEEIINHIYNNTFIQEIYSLDLDKNQKLLNLEKFKIIAQKFSINNFSLRDFILYVETGFEEVAENKTENAVELLTMHKAKGLEKKIVIIPMLHSKLQNLPDKFGVFKNKIFLNFDKAKSLELIKNKEEISKLIKQEQERLLYVALTRAEEQLILISSKSKKYSDSFKVMLENAMKGLKENIVKKEMVKNLEEVSPLNQNKEIERENINIKEELKKIKDLENWLLIEKEKAIKEQRFISVSQLMEIEKEEVVSISKNKKEKEENTALYTGIIVHDVLEEIDFTNYSMDNAIKILEKKQSKIPETIRDIVKKDAINILQNFENSELHKELKEAEIIFKELPFTYFENGKYIEGRIDIIYEKEDRIIVMDYKTNKYKNEKEKQKLLEIYKKQKEYYTKTVKKIFPHKNIVFKLGLLWKGEIFE